ncbi:hypothetical protein D3C75_1002700 [compost metagenome]
MQGFRHQNVVGNQPAAEVHGEQDKRDEEFVQPQPFLGQRIGEYGCAGDGNQGSQHCIQNGVSVVLVELWLLQNNPIGFEGEIHGIQEYLAGINGRFRAEGLGDQVDEGIQCDQTD